VDPNPTLIELDPDRSSLSILGSILGLGLIAYVLDYFGIIGGLIGVLSQFIRWGIRKGFRAWEVCFSWASWSVHLLLAAGLIGVGVAAAGTAPGVTLVCAGAAIFLGLTSCLAYMYIDIERYEVERGYKAVHNPLKGQTLAPDLARYGEQADVRLLLASALAMIGGFALLNQGLFESVGRDWYRVHEGGVGFTDFLTYTLLNLLRVVDVLDLASSQHLLRVSFVRPFLWPASVLIVLFRTFFMLVLLQQIFASIRQGRLLAETIADFWSPHEPIQQRARNALPQYGTAAIGPLLTALRSVTALTKEQRDQLPQIIAAIGPSIVPTLIRHLQDTHEPVRAVAVGALGHLNARDALPNLTALAADPSDYVRQSLAEALGLIVESATQAERRTLPRTSRRYRPGWYWGRRRRTTVADPAGMAVATLVQLLGDENTSVRGQAAMSLGLAGDVAAAAVPELTLRLRDADETVRSQAAKALGRVGGSAEEAVRALTTTLEDASAAVRASAARGLATIGGAANSAVSALIPLLQDRDEDVRSAAAEAIARAGPLDETATSSLVEGLEDADNVVRAQAAEALGTIGVPGDEAAEALVGVMRDSHDVVRAKAVEALGKIGESAADVAVPSLVKALRDKDSWVSALAAEALGEMGNGADSAVPALIRALTHVNAQVRANAAAALGKQGDGAVRARPFLEKSAADEDGGVRAEAIRALGLLGSSTPASLRLILDALRDLDPQVRASAVEALSEADRPAGEVESLLLPLLEDANDEVKVQATKVLAKQVGGTKPVLDGLCHLLTDDDSTWVQVHAALGLARLGPAGVAAGPALLRAAQTGDAGVREQAMKALAVIQPPEAGGAFTVGLKDPAAEVRLIASAGWMNADTVPDDAVDALVEALSDPEVQVRANAAHALARLERLPPAAIPPLIEAAADPSDNLRLNAVMALRNAPPTATAEVIEHLLEDSNARVQLMAAGALLSANPTHDRARTVAEAARNDPSPRVRKAAEDILRSAAAHPAAPAGQEQPPSGSADSAVLPATA
jgi:HEAT repeat protein